MSDMKHFIAIGAAAVASLAVPGAAMAAPGTPGNTVKIPLVNDCGNGSINGECLSLDAIGTFAGVVKFRHKANGDLRLMFNVKSAPAGLDYQLEVYCGNSPAQPGALIGKLPDALKTTGTGTAVAGPFELPVSDIHSACGNAGIGHVQLVSIMGGSILSAAPVNLSA
jgi:hypothetical protein